jgi:hypothetical protein
MMNPERSAILLAFEDENAVLTKRQIIERAMASSSFKPAALELQLNHLMAMGAIDRREWVSDKVSRQHFLRPKGRDMWAECNVGD